MAICSYLPSTASIIHLKGTIPMFLHPRLSGWVLSETWEFRAIRRVSECTRCITHMHTHAHFCLLRALITHIKVYWRYLWQWNYRLMEFLFYSLVRAPPKIRTQRRLFGRTLILSYPSNILVWHFGQEVSCTISALWTRLVAATPAALLMWDVDLEARRR